MSLIIVIVVLLILFGGLGISPASREYFHSGYGPGIGVGTILLVVLVCWLLGMR
jgi:hypothetical protein